MASITSTKKGTAGGRPPSSIVSVHQHSELGASTAALVQLQRALAATPAQLRARRAFREAVDLGREGWSATCLARHFATGVR